MPATSGASMIERSLVMRRGNEVHVAAPRGGSMRVSMIYPLAICGYVKATKCVAFTRKCVAMAASINPVLA